MNLVRFHKPSNAYYNNQLVNNLFNELWNTDRSEHTCNDKPAANIFELEDGFTIEMLVPGFSKDDISISVEKNLLIVKSELKEEPEKSDKEVKYSHIEFSKQEFERKYRLSEKLNAEEVSAKFENGVLTISIPKFEEEKQKLVRKIEIA